MADMTTKILTVELEADKAINGIINLNNAITKNNQTIKDNNAMIAENNKKMKESGADVMRLTAQNQKLSQSNAELEAKTKVLKDEKRLLQKETQNEIRLQTQEQGSLRQLRAELSNLTKQYDSLSRAERENVNVGGRLKSQINQVTTEIKAAEEGTQRYYRNVGNYQNAILGAIGINGQFGQSIINITNMEGGVKGALTAMGNSAKAFGKTLMGLMANPVFLAIAGIAGAGMAAKWFYDYNMGIEEAMRRTREFTGLAGDELSRLRAEIAATADTYGKEYLDVLKAADLLMSHYHLTGAEAMRVINDGFQSGADLNGNMLEKIQQYAPAFHDAGISAEQLVSLIQQTRSGIFSDQGLDAIRMGATRLREMSTSTRQALTNIGIDVDALSKKMADSPMGMWDGLKIVTTALKGVNRDTKEYGDVVTAVFGRQGRFAAQEMIEGFAEMDTSLDTLKETTGEYGELTDELREKNVELQEAMADVFGDGEAGFESLTLKAKIYIKEGLTGIVKWLKQWVTWARNTWNENDILRGVLTGIITILRVLSNVAYVPFKLLFNAAKAVIDVLSALSNALKVIWGNIKTTFNGLADIFSGIKNFSPSEVFAGIKKAASGAWETVKSFGEGVGNAFMTGFKDIVVDGIDDIGAAFQPIGDIGDIYNHRFGGGGRPSSSHSAASGGSSTTTTTTTTTTNNNNTSGGKGGTPKKNTTNSTAQSEEEKAEAERQKRLQALIKKGADLELKAREEELRATEDGIIKLYKEREDAINDEYAAITTKSTEEAEALMRAKEATLNANVEAMNKELQAYRDKQAKAQADAEKKSKDDAKRLVQTWLDASTEGTQQQLDWQLQLIAMEKAAELALYEDNEMMKQAIIAKYAKMEEDARKQHANAMMQIEQTKYNAIGSMVGGLGEVMGVFGEESKEAAVLQKTLALGEIMIAQAVAIANAVKAGSNAISPWQMIAQIATSITAVTVAMAQAFKSLNEAKFATGGYIRGAGTGTSDSIPVRVSNGESIMNANTTAMFGGLLSSLNQLGGGVPIQVQQTASSVRGEDMLARAVARGVAMLPAPVVSVEDINKGQRQVEVMHERATL